jgi:outer membrane protein assembly factor BamA
MTFVRAHNSSFMPSNWGNERMRLAFWPLLFLVLCSSVALAQPIRIDSIHIEGAKKTKPMVILRQMNVQVGDTVDLTDLEDIKKKNKENIYNLSLFTVVEVESELGPDGLLLHVRVQERWFIWPQPYLVLEERTFNEWWQDKDLDRLVYGLGVTWQNFSGWNDNLYVYAQNGYSRRLTAQFYRPFLFPKPQVDGTFSFYYVNNKEIGYGTEDGFLKLARLSSNRIRKSYTGSAVFGKRFSARDQVQLTLGYQYFDVHDSLKLIDTAPPYPGRSYLTDGANREQYPFVGLSYINDQRDMRAFPLDGYKYSAFFRALGMPGFGTSVFGKAGISFSHHIPIRKRWNFAYGTQNFFLIGKKVPYYDKFFIGFGSFLRGFEPYVIDGSVVSLNKAEVKYGIIPRKFVHLKWLPLPRFRDFPMGLYLSTFVDVGYVHDGTFNNLDPTLKDKLLLGYGAGVNVFTIYDTLLRVEYSRNNLGGWGVYINTLVSIQ